MNALLKSWGTMLGLGAILLVAAGLRLFGQGWDGGTLLHPDERFLTLVAVERISLPEQAGWGTLLDPAHSPLNPRRGDLAFHYGTLPLYVAAAGAAILTPLTQGPGVRPLYNDVAAAGRGLAAAADLLTVGLVFAIARRLYGRAAGLAAAALSALAVIQIQNAHFLISDPFLVLFLTALFYCSLVLAQTGSRRAALAAGVCLGLALACKASVAPLALVPLLAAGWGTAHTPRPATPDPPVDPPDDLPALLRRPPAAVLVGLGALVAWLVGDPYALLDLPTYVVQVAEEAAVQSGRLDVPYTLQYVGTVPGVYQLEQLARWGLGPGALAAGLVGLALAARRAWRGGQNERLLLLGCALYALTIGLLSAKWLRYVLPLVPPLCVFAGGLLAGLPGVVGRWRAGAWARVGLVGLALASSALWAGAFVQIYGQEHPRVAASRWLAANVPAGAAVSAEGWDDRLPVRVPGLAAPPYRPITFNLYDDRPSPDEYTYIRDLLAETDVLVLSSNRLYGSIPRLPWRYPVQTRFYELLFGGHLGFTLAHTETNYPHLGPWTIVDDRADESFTVYDHPKVLIYQKTATLPDSSLRLLFGAALDKPSLPSRDPPPGGGATLLLPEPLSAWPDLGDLAWNPLAQNQWVAVLLLLLVTEALGLLVWPLVAGVCRALPDRGYPLAKGIGLLAVAWPVWGAASVRLVPFTVWSLLGAIGLLAAVSAWRWRRDGAAIRAYMRTHRRLLLAWEGLFLLAFAGLLAVRLLDPDLWSALHGGEKPMDFGFLNSTLRSAWMPPPDPFYAGGYINYYYYGQYLAACLIKLTGVPPAVGYNIVLPILYGLLVLGAASVVYNAVAALRQTRGDRARASRRAFGWGLVGAAFVAVLGNLQGGLQALSILAPTLYSPLPELFRSWGFTSSAMLRVYNSFDYWPASRIIPRTINEFPYWIYLVGDLHAHLIALPFTLIALALALNLWLGAGRWGLEAGETDDPPPAARRPPPAAVALWGSSWGDAALRLGLTALVLGSLAAINSWDFITYSILFATIIGLALLRQLRQSPVPIPNPQPPTPNPPVQPPTPNPQPLLLGAALGGVALLGGAGLLYLPFFWNFHSLYSEVRPVLTGMRRTQPAEWVVIWGLFAFITLSYVALGWWRYPWATGWAGLRRIVGRAAAPPASMAPAVGLAVLIGGGIAAVICLALGQGLLAGLVLAVSALVGLLVGAVRAPVLLFAGGLLALALALTAGVELFYLADYQAATEWYRMNTVFKFYMQAWVLFGCGTAIVLGGLGGVRKVRPPGLLLRGVWVVLLVGLLGGAVAFLWGGTRSRVEERFPVRPTADTLDGMAFLDGAVLTYGPPTNTITVTLGYEGAAYRWLNANVHGLPVIATAPTAPDPEGMFVATYTGLPVVVGSMHQEEQRSPADVAARRADMISLFRTPDATRAEGLWRKYDVRYIYLGPYERWVAYDAPAGIAKFAGLVGTALDVAYENPGVTIYRVRP